MSSALLWYLMTGQKLELSQQSQMDTQVILINVSNEKY